MRRTAFLFSVALVVTSSPLANGHLHGQELPWVGRGRVRLDFAPSFWGWDSRFGIRTDSSGAIIEDVEALGMDLTADPMGSDILPYLRPLEASLGEALADQSYRVRLGTSHAVVEQSHLVFPFRLDLGVTDWLTVGAMVPFVRPRTELTFILDADSLSADVGLTPPSSSFLNSYDAALKAAESQNPGDPAVVAARAFLDALSAAYGHASVFPLAGSPTGNLLQARQDELRAALESGGVVGIPETVPLAQELMDEEAFNSLLTSPAMRAYPLENWTSPWTLGDVEITASLRLLHFGFESDSLGRLPFFRGQLGVGGLVRLGTGTQADPDRLLGTDPADGQMDYEGNAFGMVQLGSRLGAWAQARFGIQREGQIYRRIADPTEILPPLSRLAFLNRTPGNYFDLQLNPSLYFTPELTFGVRYHFWKKGEDRYSLPPLDPEAPAQAEYPPPESLNYETRQTLQEVGFSATYSSVEANARGEALLPVLVRFTYYHPLEGAGGQTPRGSRLEAGVTLYRTLWGGGGSRQEGNAESGQVR